MGMIYKNVENYLFQLCICTVNFLCNNSIVKVNITSET